VIASYFLAFLKEEKNLCEKYLKVIPTLPKKHPETFFLNQSPILKLLVSEQLLYIYFFLSRR